MSASDPTNLQPLQDAYELIAELRVSEVARAFIGKRREDGADVLITVYRSPEGEDRNALTHLAADARLLSTLRHRHLVPVLEGRWLGSDAFAVVSQRVAGSTIQELTSRGDVFSTPRIAAILREVNGILVWAREQKVVHRAVTPATVLLEPGTDHVLCSFVMRPIGLAGAPGAEGDAQAIAALAWTMFTSENRPPQSRNAAKELSERRPDLPQRVVEETEAMLGWPASTERAPDVPGYIALIAMAEALKTAEVETSRLVAEKLEEERVTREELAAQRSEMERLAAEEALRLQRERLDLERSTAKQREELSAQEMAMKQEHDQMAAKRMDLEREHAEMMQALAARQAELEEIVATEREELAEERARLAGAGRAGRRVSDAMAFETEVPVTFSPMADSPSAALSEVQGTETPAGSSELESAGSGTPGDSQPGKRVAWVVPASAVTLVVLVVATALGIGARHRRTVAYRSTSTGLVASYGLPSGSGGQAGKMIGSVVDSAGGGVITATKGRDSVSSVVPLPRRSAPLVVTRKKRSIQPEAADSSRVADTNLTVRRPDSATTARDTATVRDSIVRPKRDTSVRRDTLQKRDTTMKRDTLAKPDTVPRG